MIKNKSYIAEISERPLVENNPERFKKTQEECEEISVYKHLNKKARQKEFGAGYKSHLNTTANQKPTVVKTY